MLKETKEEHALRKFAEIDHDEFKFQLNACRLSPSQKRDLVNDMTKGF